MSLLKPRKPSGLKSVNTRIRMTQEELSALEKCAKYLKCTKSDIIIAGIYMVYDDVFGQEKSNGED